MHCFHCHEPVPRGFDLKVSIGGTAQPMCCHGCAAVAELIHERGLAQFYSLRDAPARRPDDQRRPDWAFYDRPALIADAGRQTRDGCEFLLALTGVNCAACSWLIETALMRLEGLRDLSINPVTARARVVLDLETTPLSAVLEELEQLGYRPRLLADDPRGRADREERRAALKRLVVAGFGMMQVMTYAVALYAGYFQDMTEATRDFFRLVSLVVATPVVIYSGWPFIVGALRGVRHRRPGMDLPVAIAVVSAYGASAWNTFFGGREVYFDSAVMFVFLLSVTRWIEMNLRHRAAESGAAGSDGLPLRAARWDPSSETWQEVATTELGEGDRIRVPEGEVIPVDGRLAGGHAETDESLITGESRSVTKSPGQAIIAGSVVVSGPADIEVTRTGRDTLLSALKRLMERARSERPHQVSVADRIARHLVLLVLAATGLTAIAWWQVDPSRAFETALAVLVITCPCALSLATPATLSAAMAGLARRGILVVRGDALESLPKADRIVFDKTGTLTSGRLKVAETRLLGDLDEDQCLRLAAALEQASHHPIASAFRDVEAATGMVQVQSVSGRGMEAVLDGRTVRIGHPEFVSELTREAAPGAPDHAGPVVALGDERGMFSLFLLHEDLRRDAAIALGMLGLPATVLSGDREGPVQAVADRLELADARADQTPQAKLAYVRQRQQESESVVMVGDGSNDAPVLAQADVSVAIGATSALAGREADVIILTDRLSSLTQLFAIAARTRRLIRQNLTWALIYNCAAIPLAAAGWIPPWAAAAGMSASSLMVVGNSLRAGRFSRRPIRVRTALHEVTT